MGHIADGITVPVSQYIYTTVLTSSIESLAQIQYAVDHDDDEFFSSWAGRFIIDPEGRSVELLPYQGFVVPKGVMHCTQAPEKSVILVVETAIIVPTGDA